MAASWVPSRNREPRWKSRSILIGDREPEPPVFGGPKTTLGTAAFGTISSQVNASRQTELTLRVIF